MHTRSLYPSLMSILKSQSQWERKPVQRGQRGRGKPYTGPQGMCWGCGQLGHNKTDCPSNPWQQPPRDRRGESWQQPTRGPSQGPVNPLEVQIKDIRGAQRILKGSISFKFEQIKLIKSLFFKLK